MFLRISKSSKTYVFYYATDGSHWQILRTFDLGSDLPIEVGFESQSPAGPGSVARLSVISYKKMRLGDIYK